MSAGIGVAHLPRRCFPRSGHTAPRAAPVAFGAPCWSWSASLSSARARTGHRRPKPRRTACSRSSPTRTAPRSSAGTTPARNRSRSPSPRATRPGSPPGWPASSPRPWPMARWRPATRSISANGSSGARSSRSARPATPNAGPDTFATWDPEGGRYATLSGDLLVGDDVRVVLVDPSVSTAFEIPLEQSVVAAPPAWIDSDRFVVVTGDAGEPTATIVDAETGELSDGPPGVAADRHIGQWPPDRHDGRAGCPGRGPRHDRLAGRRRVVDRLDRTGRRGDDGDRVRARCDRSAPGRSPGRTGRARSASPSTTRRADWRRVAQPEIGPARGAVVAWLR